MQSIRSQEADTTEAAEHTYTHVVYIHNGILFGLQKKVILSDAITWMVLEHVSEVKSLSCVRLFATPWTVAR